MVPEFSCGEGRIRFLEKLFSERGPDTDVEAALDAVRQMTAGTELVTAWLEWWAPLSAFEGCWLERVVTIRNAHTPLGAALLKLQRTFFLQERRSPPHARTSPPGRSNHFEDDIRWLLALKECGARMVPAVMGVTLAHAELAGGLFTLGRSADYAGTLDIVRQILNLWPSGSDEGTEAMSARLFYRRKTFAWCHCWLARNSLEERVLTLLRSKAKYGRGYHGKIKVAGRCLDDWLMELQQGRGEEFLPLFAESAYVDRECPHKSRFLTHSIAFGGPMFGVFDEAERALLLQWFGKSGESSGLEPLFSLRCMKAPRGSGLGDVRVIPAAQAADAFAPDTSPRPQRILHARLKPPQLYHHLVNGHDSPHLEAEAHRYVDQILGRARWLRKGVFAYSRADFLCYVDRLHEDACRESSPSRIRLLNRDAFRWGIEQLAPAILVDGGWLLRSLSVARWLPEVGRPLWRIWCDELGDGQQERHHGNVYRRLMESVGLELPPFTSEAFIRHPGFVAGAFDVPAFLLAIGRSPERYLPEILGLNLAIELSGLGGTYRRLAVRMEELGLDSTIVRLHQSIDNLACGHAALARDAIVDYLYRFEAGGDAAVQAQWRRIWCGWQSLLPAGLRFSGHLFSGWLTRFGWEASWRRGDRK